MNDIPSTTRHTESGWLIVATLLAALGFAIFLLWHNIADGDLFGRLAAGASVHFTGHVWARDTFAFTPTLDHWVDHEWGTGVILYSVLNLCGPGGLLALKVLLAFSALGLALATARRQAGLAALLLIAIPCAWTLIPGYVPVIRSHAFTYALFALTLWVSNRIYNGQPRLWPLLPLIMMVWVNLHGGFVTGFAVMGCHLVAAILQRGAWRPLLMGTVAAAAVTLVTPYGAGFYSYLIPALLHPRPRITEWGPMPLLGWDPFTGFRITFLLAMILLGTMWRRLPAAERKSTLPGLLLLVLTAWAAWQHRRHAPFFGLAAAATLPAAMQALLDMTSVSIRKRLELILACSASLLVTGLVTLRFLPGLSYEVLAPVGLFPVRECDILTRAGVTGNLVIPFDWGSYAAWRLYPRIRISQDGRYEETFPESTFEMNARFYNREGENWDDLIRRHEVDFVVLDHRHSKLTPADMTLCGFQPVWSSPLSSLWSRRETAQALIQAAAISPDSTIQPLDSRIPSTWPWPARR